MRKIVVLSFISLDGVMQAPGSPDEDTSGDFKYGGWTAPYIDEQSGEIMSKQMSMPFDLLLGRKTYDIFAGYWPNQQGEIAEAFDRAAKYVVSRKEDAYLTWDNSRLIDGDVVAKLKELKNEDGPLLQVYGSGDMVQTLLQNDLVDELWLKTFPVILGKGKRLFADGAIPVAFKLIETTVTPSGVIFANYERAGDVETGTVG